MCGKVSSSLLVYIFFCAVEMNTGNRPEFASALHFLPPVHFGWDLLTLEDPKLWLGLTSSEIYTSHTVLITKLFS